MKGKEMMLGVPDTDNEIELDEHRAMVCLPEHAVEITIDAMVYHDRKLCHVSKVMNMDDIREAFKKADDGYIDDEDRFMITEKGLQWLEEHENK